MDTTIDYKKLGLRLKKLRKEAGLTQEQVAEQVGVTSYYISHIETGSSGKVSLEVLLRVSRVFGKNIEYFLMDSPAALPDLLINHEIKQYLDALSPEMLHTVVKLLQVMLEHENGIK